jgi:hypothetical protein
MGHGFPHRLFSVIISTDYVISISEYGISFEGVITSQSTPERSLPAHRGPLALEPVTNVFESPKTVRPAHDGAQL